MSFNIVVLALRLYFMSNLILFCVLQYFPSSTNLDDIVCWKSDKRSISLFSLKIHQGFCLIHMYMNSGSESRIVKLLALLFRIRLLTSRIESSAQYYFLASHPGFRGVPFTLK